MKPCFLLDEHVNRAIQRQLRRLDPQIQVLAIGDRAAPPIGTSDPDILYWIEKNGYILVTKNRSTMPIHLSNHLGAGGHIPGIFWIRHGVSIRRIVEELYLIWLASELEEYQDCTLFIPLCDQSASISGCGELVRFRRCFPSNWITSISKPLPPIKSFPSSPPKLSNAKKDRWNVIININANNAKPKRNARMAEMDLRFLFVCS